MRDERTGLDLIGYWTELAKEWIDTNLVAPNGSYAVRVIHIDELPQADRIPFQEPR